MAAKRRVCPKCNRSVFSYKVVKQDPKNKRKKWQIESCSSCGFNFDIEEL